MDDLEKEISSVRRDQALSRDRLEEVNRLGNSLFLLQDRFEVMSLEMDRMQDELAGLRAAETYASTEQPAEQPRAESPSASSSEKKEDIRAPSKRKDTVAMYREAFDLLMQADYDSAAPLFHQLVNDFPRHDLADNALYWLAEIDYATENYRAAVRGFQRVLEEYPDGNKVPDALLKKAYSLIELGERATARRHLERILSDYAWSEPVEKARERLELLGARMSGSGL